MKIYTKFLCLVYFFIPLVLPAQELKLDPTFGKDGTVTLPPDLEPYKIVVQEDKKLLLLVVHGVVLLRYNPDGSIDTGFGTDGIVYISEDLNLLFLQPDGKIIAAGIWTGSEFSTNSSILMERYHQDGTLDTDFGRGGSVSLSNSFNADNSPRPTVINDLRDIIFLPDGKILLVGTAIFSKFSHDNYKMAISLMRLNNDGSLDESFSQDGKVLIPVDDPDSDNEMPYQFYVSDAAIQSGGHVVVAGSKRYTGAEGYQMVIARINPDGTLDSNFNEGKFSISGLGQDESSGFIRVLSNDNILLSSYYKDLDDRFGENTRNQLLRFLPDGSRDTSFGDNGILSGFPTGRLFILSNNNMLIMNDSIIKVSANGVIDKIYSVKIPFELENEARVYLQDDLTLFYLRAIYDWEDPEHLRKGLISKYILQESPEPATVRNLTLINAQSDDEIYQLEDGKVINLFEIDTKEINIRAFTEPEVTGSVKFTLSGTQNYSHIENVAPYALFANSGSNYFSWKPAVGTYQLTAIPYSEPQGKGMAGTPLTLSFSIIDVEVARVEKFALIDANTDKELFDLDFIRSLTIYLDEIGTSEINIRAYTNPENTGSVDFKLYRLTDHYFMEYSNIENVAPYALFRNNGSDYFSWEAEPGEYHLIATAYSEPNAMGVAGIPTELWFRILPHRMEEPEDSFYVYPNPGSDILTIPVNFNKAEDIFIRIFDLSGNEVFGKTYSNKEKEKVSVDVSGLDNSTYIVWVNGANTFKSFRWIKK